jgi:hypothetical protein
LADTAIKVGLYLDCFLVPAWVEHSIKLLVDSDFVSIDLVLINEAEAKIERSPTTGFIQQKVQKFLNSVCSKKKGPTDALHFVDISCLLTSLNKIAVASKAITRSGKVESDFALNISSYDLDVIIDFSIECKGFSLSEYAKYGVWLLRFNGIKNQYDVPLGYWEAMMNIPVCEAMLVARLKEYPSTKVLCRSWSSVNAWSIVDTENKCLWKSAYFVQRQLKTMYLDGRQNFEIKMSNGGYVDAPFLSQPVYLRNFDLLIILLQKFYSKNKERFYDLFYLAQWGLLYRFGDKITTDSSQFKKITPPKDRFWADPHVIYKNGIYFIFIEEKVNDGSKAWISVIELYNDGTYSKPVPILKENYHLSYPFVFENEKDIYMIPETSENKTIELYRCTEFPHKWVKEINLMENVLAFDTTLLFSDNRWWLFANMIDRPNMSSWDELSIFYSDDLKSTKWIAHQSNPVISDVRKARPAGAIYEEGGRLFRPSQDCSKRYGYCININEITCLTEKDYKEELREEIKPKTEMNETAVHTINHLANFTIIDVQKRIRK